MLLQLRDTGGAHGSVVELGLGPILIQPAPTTSSPWETLRRSLSGIAQSCLVRSLLSWPIDETCLIYLRCDERLVETMSCRVEKIVRGRPGQVAALRRS